VQVTKQLVDAAANGAPPAILDALAAGFISGTDDLARRGGVPRQAAAAVQPALIRACAPARSAACRRS